MTKKKINSILLFSIIILAATCLRIGWIAYQNQSLLNSPYSNDSFEKLYRESQWVQSQNVAPDVLLDDWAVKNGYTGWKNYEDSTADKQKIETQKNTIFEQVKKKGISDSTLYSYVGYQYVTGTAPHLLNPEHPPLSKYFIGWSILLFGNVPIGLFVVGVLLLIVVGWYTYVLTGSLLRASCAAFLVSMFSLYEDQLVHGPQLELFQALFAMCFLTFHLMWLKKPKIWKFILSCISLGLALSTKTVAPFIVLFGLYIAGSHWVRFPKDKKYASLSALVLLIGSGIVFTLTYFDYFMKGNSLRSFLGLQKYIISFYQSSSIPFIEFVGNYLRLIATGEWKFWDEARTVSHYTEWNVTWPLITILSIISSYRSYKTYPNLLIFIFVYHMFLFFTPIFPRYLLLLFIPSTISIVSVFGKKFV